MSGPEKGGLRHFLVQQDAGFLNQLEGGATNFGSTAAFSAACEPKEANKAIDNNRVSKRFIVVIDRLVVRLS
jgi:hypothetical protein